MSWFCENCNAVVPDRHVTYTEEHDPRYGGCGCDVTSLEAPVKPRQPDERDAEIARLREELAAEKLTSKSLHDALNQYDKEYGRMIADLRTSNDEGSAKFNIALLAEYRRSVAILEEKLSISNHRAEKAERERDEARAAGVFPRATPEEAAYGWTYSCDYILRLKDKAEDVEPDISMEQVEGVLFAIDFLRDNPIKARAEREEGNHG